MKGTLIVASGLCFGFGISGLFAASRIRSGGFVKRGPLSSNAGCPPPAPPNDWISKPHRNTGRCRSPVGWLPFQSWAPPVYGVPKLFQKTSGSLSIIKIESIATWTEMLQGTWRHQPA